MKIRSLVAIVAGALAASALVANAQSTAGQPAAATAKAPTGALDGKSIYMAQKCNLCHAVSAAQINPTGKIKAADLSTVSLKDSAEIAKYLRKEGAINGKKHAKAFTGSDDELGALIAWLQKQARPAH